MRCQCCNRVLQRTAGMRTLSTGEKVEETFCSICRNEVNKILYTQNTSGVDGSNSEVKFKDIVEQQMMYGCVTPQKNPIY